MPLHSSSRSPRLLALIALLSPLGASRAQAAPPRAASTPTLPAPQVTLDVEPSGAPASPLWTLRVKNTGSVPLRLVTDPRLLRLELPPAAAAGPRAPKVVVCALPDAARPFGDGDARVLAPGKTYTERFDIRTLCFGEEAARALGAASHISATYGFSGKTLAPPFVVGPLDDGAAPALASARQIAMAARPLAQPTQAPQPASPAAPASPPTAPAAAATTPTTEVPPPRLVVTQTRRVDTDSAGAATLTVTLKNTSSRSVTLAFRPSSLALRVLTPSGGVVLCAPAGLTSVSRELVTTLGAGRSASQTVVLGRVCPPDTFAERGVYEIAASVDNRRTVVAAGTMATFVGVVAAPEPTLLRVRSGRTPLVPGMRATFD